MKIKYDDINSLDDLHAQVRLLKAEYIQRGEQLKSDGKSYIKQFTPGNLIKKFATPSGLLKLDEQTNISGKIMSVVLPMILNSTVLRGSGFITKALGTFVSGKLGNSLDAEHIAGIVNAVKSIFKGKKKDKKQVAFVDYGIPPDSETF